MAKKTKQVAEIQRERRSNEPIFEKPAVKKASKQKPATEETGTQEPETPTPTETEEK